MKCFIVLSVCMFAVVTFLINREKLASKYNVVLVSKHDLKQYVNVTLRGVHQNPLLRLRPEVCRDEGIIIRHPPVGCRLTRRVVLENDDELRLTER